jgi:hypothetical protein
VPVPVVKIRHLTAEPQLHGYHDAITDPAGKSFSSRRDHTGMAQAGVLPPGVPPSLPKVSRTTLRTRGMPHWPCRALRHKIAGSRLLRRRMSFPEGRPPRRVAI